MLGTLSSFQPSGPSAQHALKSKQTHRGRNIAVTYDHQRTWRNRAAMMPFVADLMAATGRGPFQPPAGDAGDPDVKVYTLLYTAGHGGGDVPDGLDHRQRHHV